MNQKPISGKLKPVSLTVELPFWIADILQRISTATGVKPDSYVAMALGHELPDRLEELERMSKYFPGLMVTSSTDV